VKLETIPPPGLPLEGGGAKAPAEGKHVQVSKNRGVAVEKITNTIKLNSPNCSQNQETPCSTTY
ncbi:hypothetical protein NB584_05350, partial [Vibrio cholerae]|jgi:hypothetical protein|uniref:hypothetical protein n=1 Tax=Vibrio cholerae TaxID=666 RepID=UPI00215C0A9D